VDELLRTSTYFQHEEQNEQGKAVVERYKPYGMSTADEHQREQVRKERLDRKLLLLVRQKFGSSSEYASPWTLPMLKNDGSESLRQVHSKLGSLLALYWPHL
jgi:hypothetical protein